MPPTGCVIPGAIDVHTHMELPFGGTFAKDTFETGTRAAAFGGTTTIIDFAVQSRGEVAARGPRRVAREGRGQRARRLRLPHDHVRRQRRHAGRDGQPGRRGRHRLQALHRLPGRLLLRRRRDLPGDAADRPQRRADHDARRERAGDRRRRRRAGGARARPTPTTTASPATRSSRARRRTASSAWPRRPACPSTSSTSRHATRWPRCATAATAARRPSPRRARSTCSSRWMTWATASTAPSSSALPRSARPTTRPTSGRAWSRTTCRWSRPTTARSTSRPEAARRRATSARSQMVCRESRIGSTCSTTAAWSAAGSARERWVEVFSAAPARLFGLAGVKGVVAVGRRCRPRRLRPDGRAHDLRREPPHGRRLLGLRGPRRCAAGRRRCCPAAASSSATGEFTGERGWGRFLRRDRADYARLACQPARDQRAGNPKITTVLVAVSAT